jgi:uncharacterized protein YuzE
VVGAVTTYDPEADILYLELRSAPVARSVEHGWGLVDLGDDGQPVGMEYWDASQRLPSDLLGALPAPIPPVQAA